MKFILKRTVSLLTAFTFLITSLSSSGLAQLPVREVPVPSPFNLTIPAPLGNVERLISGTGPTIVHIQTAHGNYEAQKNIQAILHYLKKEYGFDKILVEGSHAKLKPEVFRFLPERQDLASKIHDGLTKKAILKGADLFLIEDKDAEGLGIEELQAYRDNGEAFKAVLRAQEKTRRFVQDLNLQIDRLTAPLVHKNLRNFLKRCEAHETRRIPVEGWMQELRSSSQKYLSKDPGDPAYQYDWPMFVRYFKLFEFGTKMDVAALAKEKEAFLRILSSPNGFVGGLAGRLPPKADPPQAEKHAGMTRMTQQLRQEIRHLLEAPAETHFPSPDTELLVEKMVGGLPQNFDYKKYPNLNYFLGTRILQSELEGGKLLEEMARLTDLLQGKLAVTAEEKAVVGLLKDYRLLQKLFRLELTPGEYEQILKQLEVGSWKFEVRSEKRKIETHRKIIKRPTSNLQLQTSNSMSLRPSTLVSRLADLNATRRVREMEFAHLQEIDALFDKAMEFYRLVKRRDELMLKNVERILKKFEVSSLKLQVKNKKLKIDKKSSNFQPQTSNSIKAVLITGGFHAQPFEDYFRKQGMNYALVTPKISTIDSAREREAYIDAIFQDTSRATKATLETADVLHARAELRELGNHVSWLDSQLGEISREVLQREKERISMASRVQTHVGRYWDPDADSGVAKQLLRSESRQVAKKDEPLRKHHNGSQIQQAATIIRDFSQQKGGDNKYVEIWALLTALYGGSVQYHTQRLSGKDKTEEEWIQHRYDNLTGLLNFSHSRKISSGKPVLTPNQQKRVRELIRIAKKRLSELGIRVDKVVGNDGTTIGQILSVDPRFQNPYFYTVLGNSENLKGVTEAEGRLERAFETPKRGSAAGGRHFSTIEEKGEDSDEAYLRRFKDIFEPSVASDVHGEPQLVAAEHNTDRGPSKGGIHYVFDEPLKNDPTFMRMVENFEKLGLNIQEGRYFHRKYNREKVMAQAFTMTAKTAVAGLPYGGRKGSINFVEIFDKNGETVIQNFADGVREAKNVTRNFLMRTYARKMKKAGKIGASRISGETRWAGIPATDVGTTPHDMDLSADEVLEVIYEEAKTDGSIRDWDPDIKSKFQAVPSQTPGSLTEPQYLKIVEDYFASLRESGTPLPSWAIPLAEAMATFTSKSEGLGGSVLRSISTALGGMIVLKDIVYRDYKLPIKGMTAKVMGAGNVGWPAIEKMITEGIKVQAIKEMKGGVYKADGFTLEDIQVLKKMLRETGGLQDVMSEEDQLKWLELNDSPNRETLLQEARLEGYYVPDAKLISEDELLTLNVYIYVLAAKENAVTKDNVRKMKADIYLELANGAITNEAYDILMQSNTMVIPDTLANAGGVIVSYYEWLQNLRNERWTEAQVIHGIPGVIEGLESQLLAAVERVDKIRQEFSVQTNGKKFPLDWRTAADILMIREVLAAWDRNRAVQKQKRKPVAESKRRPRSEVREQSLGSKIKNFMLDHALAIGLSLSAIGIVGGIGITATDLALRPFIKFQLKLGEGTNGGDASYFLGRSQQTASFRGSRTGATGKTTQQWKGSFYSSPSFFGGKSAAAKIKMKSNTKAAEAVTNAFYFINKPPATLAGTRYFQVSNKVLAMTSRRLSEKKGFISAGIVGLDWYLVNIYLNNRHINRSEARNQQEIYRLSADLQTILEYAQLTHSESLRLDALRHIDYLNKHGLVGDQVEVIRSFIKDHLSQVSFNLRDWNAPTVDETPPSKVASDHGWEPPADENGRRLETRAPAENEIEKGVIKVLLADQPANPETVTKIAELLTGFGEQVVFLNEGTGIGKDEIELGRFIEKNKPEIVLLRSKTTAFKKPGFVAWAKKQGVRTLIRMGAGTDNIHRKAAQEAGISVIRTHGNANSVANLTLRLLLAALDQEPTVADDEDVSADPSWNQVFDLPIEQFIEALKKSEKEGRGSMDPQQKERVFRKISAKRVLGILSQLNGKTIGLVGWGPIAQLVAYKLKILREITGIKFTVLATSPNSLAGGDSEAIKQARDLGVEPVLEGRLLARSDILSFHLPAGEKPYFNQELLAKARRLKMILNTSREELIQPEALTAFLSYRLRGLGWVIPESIVRWIPKGIRDIFFVRGIYFADVDLRDKKGNILSSIAPFLNLPNAILVPHIGAFTRDAGEGVEHNTLPTLGAVINLLLGREPEYELDIVNQVPLRAEARSAPEAHPPLAETLASGLRSGQAIKSPGAALSNPPGGVAERRRAETRSELRAEWIEPVGAFVLGAAAGAAVAMFIAIEVRESLKQRNRNLQRKMAASQTKQDAAKTPASDIPALPSEGTEVVKPPRSEARAQTSEAKRVHFFETLKLQKVLILDPGYLESVRNFTPGSSQIKRAMALKKKLIELSHDILKPEAIVLAGSLEEALTQIRRKSWEGGSVKLLIDNSLRAVSLKGEVNPYLANLFYPMVRTIPGTMSRFITADILESRIDAIAAHPKSALVSKPVKTSPDVSLSAEGQKVFRFLSSKGKKIITAQQITESLYANEKDSQGKIPHNFNGRVQGAVRELKDLKIITWKLINQRVRTGSTKAADGSLQPVFGNKQVRAYAVVRSRLKAKSPAKQGASKKPAPRQETRAETRGIVNAKGIDTQLWETAKNFEYVNLISYSGPPLNLFRLSGIVEKNKWFDMAPVLFYLASDTPIDFKKWKEGEFVHFEFNGKQQPLRVSQELEELLRPWLIALVDPKEVFSTNLGPVNLNAMTYDLLHSALTLQKVRPRFFNWLTPELTQRIESIVTQTRSRSIKNFPRRSEARNVNSGERQKVEGRRGEAADESIMADAAFGGVYYSAIRHMSHRLILEINHHIQSLMDEFPWLFPFVKFQQNPPHPGINASADKEIKQTEFLRSNGAAQNQRPQDNGAGVLYGLLNRLELFGIKIVHYSDSDQVPAPRPFFFYSPVTISPALSARSEARGSFSLSNPPLPGQNERRVRLEKIKRLMESRNGSDVREVQRVADRSELIEEFRKGAAAVVMKHHLDKSVIPQPYDEALRQRGEKVYWDAVSFILGRPAYAFGEEEPRAKEDIDYTKLIAGNDSANLAAPVRLVLPYNRVSDITNAKVEVLADFQARNPLVSLMIFVPGQTPLSLREFGERLRRAVLSQRNRLKIGDVNIKVVLTASETEAVKFVQANYLMRSMAYGNREEFLTQLDSHGRLVHLVRDVETADPITDAAELVASLRTGLYSPEAPEKGIVNDDSLLSRDLEIQKQVRAMLEGAA